MFINAIGTVSQRCQPGPRGVSGVTKRQPPPVGRGVLGRGTARVLPPSLEEAGPGVGDGGAPTTLVCHAQGGLSQGSRIPRARWPLVLSKAAAQRRGRPQSAGTRCFGATARKVEAGGFTAVSMFSPHSTHTCAHVCTYTHTQAQVHNDMLALTCEPTRTHTPCRRKFLVVGNGSAGLSVRRQHGAARQWPLMFPFSSCDDRGLSP